MRPVITKNLNASGRKSTSSTVFEKQKTTTAQPPTVMFHRLISTKASRLLRDQAVHEIHLTKECLIRRRNSGRDVIRVPRARAEMVHFKPIRTLHHPKTLIFPKSIRLTLTHRI